jgi:hypothetical protein
MAIPMKRQMINVEQLRFPSGIAAAETLKALHSTGSKGMRSAQALGVAGLLAGLYTFWNDGLGLISEGLGKLSVTAALAKLSKLLIGPVRTTFTTTLVFDPIFMAAGLFTGMRVCVSMIVAGTLCWAVFCPIMLNNGTIKLTIQEPIPALPAVVDFEAAKASRQLVLEADQTIKFRPIGSRPYLEWSGVMTPAQRTALLALSPDAYFQSAVNRLYMRSQYRTAAPLAALPPGVQLPDDLKDVVRFDRERGLVAEQLISVEQHQKLRQLSADPEYAKALDELYGRSRLVSFEPLWVSADLPKLPEGFRIPKEFTALLTYDGVAKALLWRGAMSGEQHASLLKLSDDLEYHGAVAKLLAASGARALPAELPPECEGIVRYDAPQGALVAVGAVPDNLAGKLGKLRDAPGYQRTVKALVRASQAGRAVANFRDLVFTSLWAGTACMVTSGLLAFALQWRSAVRAFGSLGKMFSKTATSVSSTREQMDAIETPGSWFVAAQLVSLVALGYLAHMMFGMPYWQSTVAVLLSFALALVACRVTGETDTTPVGAMGKITQLTFGALSPTKSPALPDVTQAMNINLMAANITAAAAGGSADLLTDLKSGYLLGAHPRKQFLAQFAGIFIGTIVTVTCFRIMVPSADVLGSDTFPAPAALTWKAVAEALSKGIGELSAVKLWLIAIGGAVGIVLPVLAKLMPKQAKYMPSAAGVGLAWTFHWYYSLMFFLGALIGYIWEQRHRKSSEEYAFPVASGVVAGGALVGVVLIFVENGPEMIRQLLSGG